jgi:ribonuclease P protein component
VTNAPFAPPRSPNSGGYRYPKTNRLLKSADFRKVYDQGSRFSCPYFVAFLLRQSANHGPRFGFTIPRAVGKAHDRNRIRRRIREMIRVRLAGIDANLDVVINPRRAALEAPQADLARQVERLLERCRA